MNSSFNFLLVFSILMALGFDIMNGFHDAANSIATVVSTRVLRPLAAVLWAAFFNIIAMVIFGPKVAETVSQIIDIAPGDPSYIVVILSALIGALLWNLLTWWLGLPTSSSHALIGALAGAALVHGGWQVLHLGKLLVVIEFIFLSPLIGWFLASLFVLLLYWIFRKNRPGLLNQRFKKGQLFSAALYSIGHGANDAQKTMGIILALLIASNHLSKTTELSLYHGDTLWIILSCYVAMGLGTLFGGWRIIKTMGMKIAKIRPIGGFSAETAGSVALYLATLFGIPVSTTHTITGAIIGVGSTTSSLSRVNWQVAARIVWAWMLTIPGAAFLAALIFLLLRLSFL